MSIDLHIIKETLEKDQRILFAYLYGSCMESDSYHDVDIAVYSDQEPDVFGMATDIKIELHRNTGLPPDFFDIRIINDIVDKGDLFGLLYLKSVFKYDTLLTDKDFNIRAEFIEKYSMKYRECEGLLSEIVR